MTKTMLAIEDLTFGYGNRMILDHLSLSLRAGEIAAIIGPSGCGKTTLFKLVAGILRAKSGKIFIENQLLPTNQNQVAYMMQEDLLLPWCSVLSNVMLITELGSQSKQESIRQDAIRLLHDVGLAGCEELYPHQLSGGMRQRVPLARALLQNRPLLLLDEPFGSLDISLREHMYVLLRKIHEKYNTTILMITHDFRDAISIADRVLLLNHQKVDQEWEVSKKIRENSLEYTILSDQLRQSIIEQYNIEQYKETSLSRSL